MRDRSNPRPYTLLCLLALLCIAPVAHAQWIAGGRLVPYVSSEFVPRLVTDGAHGSFVLTDRLTHLDPKGRIIGGGGAGFQPGPTHYNIIGVDYYREIDIAPDGQGGLYLSRTMYAENGDLQQGGINVNHLRPDLTLDPAWPEFGVDIAPATGLQQSARLLPDPSGDVYVSWSMGIRSGLQRLTRTGQPAPGWPAGGGVIYQHPRAEANFGDALWTPAGIVRPLLAYSRTYNGYYFAPDSLLNMAGTVAPDASASPAFPGFVRPAELDLLQQQLAHDGGAGLYATNTQRPYHLLPDLSIDPLWPAPEVLPSTSPYYFYYQLPVPDGAGGCFLVRLERGASMVTHIMADGHPAPGWTVAGTAALPVTPSALIPDGTGGALLFGIGTVKNPLRAALYAHHANAHGGIAPVWPAAGKVLATANTISQIRAIPDGVGGAVVVWWNISGNVSTVRALGITADGNFTTGVDDGAPRVVQGLSASPSPSTGTTTLHFTLARPAVVSLDVVDVTGRLVRRFESGTASAGGHAIEWDGLDDTGRRVAPGVYLARAVLDDVILTTRVVRLR